MSGQRDSRPRIGNPEIGIKGAEYAKAKAAESDRKLDAAKLEFEADIKAGRVRGVTAQDVLRRAGLKPHFLSKPARRNTNEALKIWLRQQNGRVGRAARTSDRTSDERKALTALQHDFAKLQGAYHKDWLVGLQIKNELTEQKLASARLTAEIARLRGLLRSADLPDDGP